MYRPNATDYTGIFDGTPEVQHYEKSEADHELATNLRQWFEESYQHRLSWERTWDLNLLYLRGDQLLGKHKVTGEIIRLSTEDSKKLRSQNNILRPTARSLVGKLSRLIPTYTVQPATSDFEEQHGARVADTVLQYLRRKEDLDLVYTEMCGYLPWAGNAFAQLCWDPQAGRRVVFCNSCYFFSYDTELKNQPCPQCAMAVDEILAAKEMEAAQLVMMGGMPPPPPEELPEVPDLVEAKEGDVKVHVRDPRDVFLPVGCTSVKAASRFCVREVTEVQEARRRYPKFAMFIQQDSDVNTDQSSKYRWTNDSSAGLTQEHVFIYEFHEGPTEAYEDGRVIVMINDNIVEERPGYWGKLNRHPLYHFGFDPIEGELYREAFISQAWHRQRELNMLETQLREGTEQMLRRKLMNPIGSRISADEFMSYTDQVITYNPGAGKPEWIEAPDIPVGLWTRKPDLLQDIRMLASITEPEAGLSTADPNGRAMAIINAEADQQVGPIMHRNNAEWRELNRGALTLYQCYAHPDRVATVSGPDGSQTFSFGELSTLQAGWDITMEQEEGLSRNPAVRLTQAMDLAQMGYFMDPMTGLLDKKAFARYAKLKLPDAGYDQEATERAAASQIPYILARGMPWQPKSFDVPHIFEEELGAWLRGPGRQADPFLAMQVEQVWMFYAEWAMLGAPGQVPPVGGPGGPSQSGTDTSAPGGTPNNAGHIGAEQQGVAGDAGMAVAQADATASAAAAPYDA